ncbi:MAG: PAS domain S-box protein, partial [Deltaproteobacteria bacterium]
GVVKGEELWLKKKDGSFFVGSISAVAVKDEQGQVTYYDGIIDNIEDRKLAEFQKESALEALRESEERFRSLYENSTVGLYRPAPDGKIHLANPVLVRMLGYLSFSHLSNRNLKKNGFGPTYPRRQFVETIEKDGEVRGLESAWTRKDGTIFYCRESARAIRDGQGKTLYYDGIVEDITERKQAEEALKESEIKYRELVENSPDAIAIYVAGKIVYTNKECLHLLAAASSAELIGKSVIQFVHPDYRALVIKRMKKFANERIVSPLSEEKFVRLDGSNVEVEVMAIPIKFENKLAVQLIIRNISERKQAEAEKRVLEERLQWAEKMEAIGTLAGGIAHDFNNLLMGIQGYASMILSNLDPTHPNYERLKRIESQVQSGADLTNQLLGFARGGRYEVKPTDMNDIIEKTSSMFGRTKKEISMHRKHGKDLWSVEVDRGQMEQVFVNLYVNAWQAMAGGGAIHLETENIILNDEKVLPYSVPPGKYVKITVTDTGTGMDEKTRLRIFDPFFTTKKMGRGIGLGLASVYGIIKGHRGMINVYSEPGHGTTFTIYLPASEKEVVKEEAAIRETLMGTETILLVEDEKIVMEVNRELLQSMGYKVYAVGSGQEGIAVYLEKRNKIDLVILDMVMPGVSG